MKRMKKLLAVVLALAMVLSLGVSALASNSGEQTDYTTATDELTGSTTNEGAMEANKISIILPVTTTGMYDMKLDPHDLIFRTSADKYTGKTFDYVEDANSNPTQKLFFLTNATVTGDQKNYTKDSAALKIINKGMDDIDVTVTVEVDVKDNEFDFVAADGLDNAAEEAQMYLAVVSGNDKEVVTAPAADAEGEAYDPSAKITSGTYLKDAALTILNADAVTESINNALGNVKIVANYDGDSSGKVTFTLQGVDSDVIEVTGLPSDGIVGDSDGGDKDVELMINDGSNEFAKVTFKVDTSVTAAINTATNAAEIKLAGGGVKLPVSSAVLTKTVAGSPDAFVEEWNTSKEAYVWTRLPATPANTGDPAFAEADYKDMSFNLTGNINAADAWDDLSAADNAIDIKVIWKAEKSTGGDSGNGGSGATNANPTVTLKSAPLSSVGAVTYTVTYGSGTGARAKVNKVYCTRNNAENVMSLATTADLSEITFTPTGMQYNNGTDWKIEFTDADGNNAITLDLPSFKA